MKNFEQHTLNKESLEKDPRQIFETEVMRDDVVDFFLSKTPEELTEEFGPEVARMVNYDQQNIHHCYDLWEHTLRTVETIPQDKTDSVKLRVAAFFHDIGKPEVAKVNEQTGMKQFFNHPEHSEAIAKPLLESLGYQEDEVKQIGFLIAHHDDFMSYKSTPVPKNHAFLRDINANTVAERIIANKFNFEKMGYDKFQTQAIIYQLAHSSSPDFTLGVDQDGQPKKVIFDPIDMKTVASQIQSGNYSAEYQPSILDYYMLLAICCADSSAQAEDAIIKLPDGNEIHSTRRDKIDNVIRINDCLEEAFAVAESAVSPESLKNF